MAERTYDIVAFGASGFTGRQVARYLAGHPDCSQFRFAIAGRSEPKLKAVAEELAKDGLKADGVIVADGLDGEAMDSLASETRVVLSTAGPFAKFGSELVRACVQNATDYVDITGETPWVKALIDQHHERALDQGTRIIPCCGFDSIPSDLGALYAAHQLQAQAGVECQKVSAFHRAQGGLNGGTVASMLNLQREGKMSQLKDLFLLNPAGSRPSSERPHRDPVGPFYSKEAQAWAAPFFMGPINTRVVRRSQALLAYQPAAGSPFASDFVYQEYWKASGVFGFGEASAMATVQAGTSMMGWLPGASALVERMTADPGEGPSEKTMDNGFFSCDLYAHGTLGDERGDRSMVHARLEGKGDPGNRITVKCVCESALLLVLGEERPPGSLAGGMLTPATALGLPLVGRLEAAGVSFSASLV